MKILKPLKTLFYLIILTFFIGTQYSFSEKKPNIIIIVCDDLNDSIEGMGGHPQAKTPNIDRLARNGVRFMNAASNSPICGPSRASMWSGIHPVNTGMYGGKQQQNRWHNNEILKDKKTLFETLIDAGYVNFTTGKIQHNGHENKEVYRNKDGTDGYGSLPNFGPYPNDGKEKNFRQGVLPPWWSQSDIDKGSRPYDGFGPLQDIKKYGKNWKWTMAYYGDEWDYRSGHDRDLMPDEVHAKEAVNFLQKDFKKPFLLTVGFSRPHSPWYAPQEYFDLFPIDEIKLTNILENDMSDCAKILAEDNDLAQPWGWWKFQKYQNMSEGKFKAWTQAYLACVAFVDAQVGKVLEAVESRDDFENTLIIFTSDHGYHMGEKDYIFKLTPWEESVRIPLVVSGPNISKGKECPNPVSLIDIFPTCMDYAQTKHPHNLDGYSLRQLLENPMNGKWSGPKFSLAACGSQAPIILNKPAPAEEQHLSLRTQRFRYIRCRNGEEELYDHFNDPFEWKNLSKESEYIHDLNQMRLYLDNELDKLRKKNI